MIAMLRGEGQFLWDLGKPWFWRLWKWRGGLFIFPDTDIPAVPPENR